MNAGPLSDAKRHWELRDFIASFEIDIERTGG